MRDSSKVNKRHLDKSEITKERTRNYDRSNQKLKPHREKKAKKM